LKKIIYIVTDLNVGGAENVLLRLLSKIDKKEYDPLVISLIEKGEIGRKIEKLGIDVYCLRIHSFINLFPGLIRLVNKINIFNPQIIHTFMIHPAFFVGIIVKLLNKPTIIWNIFSTDLSLQSNKYKTRLIIKMCASLSKIIPNRIIVDSYASYSAHKKARYSWEKMQIINNGVDTNIFFPNELKRNKYRQQYFKEDELVIGLIARYHPVKGHDIFIKAVNLLRRKVNNVKFLLNGSNIKISNSKLMKIINKEGIQDIIHLSDSKLEITNILLACDILVSSSKFESFPNIICEAMACSIPCVVTNVGDCAEIVGDTGVIVSANDPNELASAIMGLINMPLKGRKKLGENARLRIKNNFSLSLMVEKYNNLYSSCD